MQLYVANPTRQIKRFYHRTDFDSAGAKISQTGVLPKYTDIPSGKQNPVGGTLIHQAQYDTLVRQLQTLGGLSIGELGRLPNRVVDFIYGDRPIAKSAIDKVANHNIGVLGNDGAKRREDAAIAAAELVESPQAKVSIEQIEDVEGGGKKIAEGFVIDKTVSPPSKDRNGKRIKGQQALASLDAH